MEGAGMTMLAAALLLLVGPPATGAMEPAATAVPLWSIHSDDCVSVSADGDPWQECGFQAFAMTPDASRTLTVGTDDSVQLWDENGREIRRLRWEDDPSGATGYPSARVAIVGKLGVAVVHHNQLMVIDLKDGAVLARRVLDAMTVDEIKRVGPERLFAGIRDARWNGGAEEILLPSGEARALPGFTDLMRTGPAYWVTGAQPPFILHRAAGGPDLAMERSCMPLDERYCTWRDIPGSALYVLDVPEGRWRRFDLGRVVDGYVTVDPLQFEGRFYALICERAESAFPNRRPCAIVDLESRREIYRFAAGNAVAVAGRDERGRPEFRLKLGDVAGDKEDRRVGLDGTVRLIDSRGWANLSPPGGELLIPLAEDKASLLLDAGGAPVARLPFPARTCGNGWPSWREGCAVSADGRKWLVPVETPVAAHGGDQRVNLALYQLPAAAGSGRGRP
jgi:hypothetical protein